MVMIQIRTKIPKIHKINYLGVTKIRTLTKKIRSLMERLEDSDLKLDFEAKKEKH